MKPKDWLIIVISLLAVAWILFHLDLWANEWKDLFFYMDDWRMYVIVFAAVAVVGYLIRWLLVSEVRALKRR